MTHPPHTRLPARRLRCPSASSHPTAPPPRRHKKGSIDHTNAQQRPLSLYHIHQVHLYPFKITMPYDLTESDARALHNDRLDYALYTGRSTNLNELLFWEKKADGDHLMTHPESRASTGHGKNPAPVSASFMALGYVSRQGCFTSPRWMVSSEFPSASRKHSLRLVSANAFRGLQESFRNTWKTLESIQDSDPAWKGAKKAHMLDGEGADTGGAIVLKLPAYTSPDSSDPWDEGDWNMINEWDGDGTVKSEIRKIMETGRVPQLLKVYDNETEKRLTADEIEARLPGALVEVLFSIKHNYIRQSKSHSFSATIQQIIVIQTLQEEPMPTIFDNHDPSTPLILSPRKKRVRDDEVTPEEYEAANSQASPSKRSRKAATTSKSPPKQTNTRKSRRRTKQTGDVNLAPKGKGKQKAIVVDSDNDEETTNESDTVKSE
ncbi:hypothetical protein FRC01_003020 [Tulasnella sp. 417]|nr:hypothetical protein FRC01_003020 [Tulasnella sp. 417]